MRKRIREAIKEALPVIGFILAGTALALLALGNLTPAAMADNDELVAKQAKAHEIAELARELGLSEDDAVIKRASALWWEWEEQKTEEPERTCIGNSNAMPIVHALPAVENTQAGLRPRARKLQRAGRLLLTQK